MESIFQKIDSEKQIVTSINECPVCHLKTESTFETESWIAEMMSENTSYLCADCKAKQEAEYQTKATAERNEKRLNDAGIPQEFRTYDKEKGNYQLFRWVWDNKGENLIISGPNDIGKTRASTIALVHMLKRGEECRFIRFSELVAKYAAISKKESEKAFDYILSILNTGTLLIDDIGKRRITENAGEMLYEIFDRVYAGDARAKVWFTINKELCELLTKFENPEMGNAVVSRIDRMITDGKMKKWSAIA